jgi:glycosyltransferase involved in cell wall biosynthesis
MSEPLRIAWLGPVGDGGGVASMGTVMMRGVLDTGIEVDYFTETAEEDLPEPLRRDPKPRLFRVERGFEWDRWYSRNKLGAFVSGAVTLAGVHVKLSRELIRQHAIKPYDRIFQLSQTELFLLGRHADELPPIIVHPCTHAAGELRWHRRERRYALAGEGALRWGAVDAWLQARAIFQRRELRHPSVVIGPSRTFLGHLVRDYGVPEARTRVLRHPVDLDRFPTDGRGPAERPVTLLYVSRFSVRKGVEMIVELSKRLVDLEGRVRMEIVGGPSLWSDYSSHLDALEPRIAVNEGEKGFEEMPGIYRSADILLMPSHYEPGSLVVGEAMASGLPVVTSDEVGPAEVLPRDVCRTFPSGDMDAFEAEVRRLVADVERDRPTLSDEASRVVREQFAPELVTRTLIEYIRTAAK